MPKHNTYCGFVRKATPAQVRRMYVRGSINTKAVLILLRPKVIEEIQNGRRRSL